jgi:hypothetical protein
MDDTILAVYGLRAALLHALGHAEAPHQQLSDAEVITTGLVAMGCCRGHVAAARARLPRPRSRPHRLSRSRVNRRRHRLTALFVRRFDLGGCTWKPLKTASLSVIDRFPVAVCDHDRMPRAK